MILEVFLFLFFLDFCCNFEVKNDELGFIFLLTLISVTSRQTDLQLGNQTFICQDQPVANKFNILYLHKSHNAPLLSPKNLSTYCFRFLLAHLHALGEIGNNDYVKFWGIKELYYGISASRVCMHNLNKFLVLIFFLYTSVTITVTFNI